VAKINSTVKKLVSVLIIVTFIVSFIPLNRVKAFIADPQDLGSPGEKFDIRGTRDVGWVLDGYWTVYDDTTGKVLGTDAAFTATKVTDNPQFNLINADDLNDWIEAFNGVPKVAKILLSPYTLVRKSDGAKFQRYYIREVVDASGGYVKGWDADKGEVYVVPTKAPSGGIWPKEYSITAGEETTIKITGGSYVCAPEYKGIVYEFYIDGQLVDEGEITGENVFEKEINYTFSSGGSHKATLALCDMVGRTNIVEKTINVSEPASPPEPPAPPPDDSGPTADFDMPDSGEVGQEIEIRNTSTASGDNWIVHSEWEITPSSYDDSDLREMGGTVIFKEEGTYEVTLTVWDNNNNSDSITKTIYIGEPAPPPPPPPPPNSPPTAKFSMPSSAKQGDTVNVVNRSYDDGEIVDVDWDIRPRNGVDDNLGFDGGTITFTREGTYTVTLEVTDDQGATDETSKTIEITNQPPVAKIKVPSEVLQGDDVTIKSTSYDPDGEIVAYHWEITPSDTVVGTVEGEESTVYFDKEGDYTIRLTVEDEWGLTDTAEAAIHVKPAIPTAFFAWDGEPKQNRKMVFDAADSYSPDRYPIVWERTQWEIIPPDGVSEDAIKIKSSGDLSVREVVFKKPGNYTVRLAVTNTVGHTSEWYEETIEIRPDKPPVADFYTLKTIRREPENNNKATIYLQDRSYSEDGDDISRRIWKYRYDSDNDGDFNDETWVILDDGNNLNPKLETTEVGKYQFELYVEESFGQPTIPEFITPEDTRSDNTDDKPLEDKTVEVINIQPLVNFNPIAQKLADIAVIDMKGVSDIESKTNSIVSQKLGANGIIATTRYYKGIVSSKWAIVGVDSGWGMTGAWAGFLDERNIPYDKISVDQMGSADFSKYSHMVITGDQPSSFFTELRKNKTKFEDWVRNGGILFFERTDGGWNSPMDADDGNIFGWEWVFDLDRYNYVVDENSPITEGVSGTLKGNYASHGYFTNLPSGTNIILRDTASHPTLIEFDYGRGHVIASGNPLEFYITGRGSYSGWKTISNNIISYMYDLQVGSISFILSTINFSDNTFPYIILIADKEIPELDDPIKSSLIISRLIKDNTAVIVLGSQTNQSQMIEFINKNNGRGTFIINSNIDNSLNGAADYIVNDINQDKTDQISYVLVNEKVKYETYYSDIENDPEYDRRWKYIHDPYYFENSMGEAGFNNQFLPDPITYFSKVGKYEVFFQAKDNPKDDDRFNNYRLWSHMPLDKKIIYVHRKPIAQYTYQLIPNGETTVNTYERHEIDFSGEGGRTAQWNPQFDAPDGSTIKTIEFMTPHAYDDYWRDYLYIEGYKDGNWHRIKDYESQYEYTSEQISDTINVEGKGYTKVKFYFNMYDRARSARGNPDGAYIRITYTIGTITSYNVNFTNHSYDLDHESEPQKGIVEEEWKWKEINESSWHTGKPTVLEKDKTYMVYLRVKDKEGVWSDADVKLLDTSSDNKAPIAQFGVTPNPLPQGKTLEYEDYSYDPDGDAITGYHWRVKTPDGNWTDCGSNFPENIYNELGEYWIELEVYDGSLWSDPFYQTVEVIPDNQKPIASFDFTHNPAPKDVELGYIDNSYDPDGDPIVAWEWQYKKTSSSTWLNGHPTDLSSLDTGDYEVRLRVKDQPALAQMTPKWSDWFSRILHVIQGNQKPVARFTISPNPAVADEPVIYNDTSYDPDGAGISERVWQVKDEHGNVLAEYHNTTPPSIFEATGWGDDGAGEYTIRLRVKDISPNGLSPALWSDWAEETLIIEDPLYVEGNTDRDTYAAGEAMILTAHTEGKAFKVEAEMWWAPGENGFADTNVTELIPEHPVGGTPPDINRWETRHDVLGGNYDKVVIIPYDMPDGTYTITFTAYKRRHDGTIRTVTDTKTVHVSGSQLNKLKTRLRSY